MTKLRLAAAALNQTPLAWETNRTNIVAAIDAAHEAEAGLLCLPELCISGYGCEDAFFSRGVQQTSLDMLVELLPATHGIAVALGLPLVVGGRIYNAAAFACDGRLIGFVLKQKLAGDGIHYEPRWFHPWPAGEVAEVSVAGKSYPAGDLVFNCEGVKVGMEICRDAWVEDRPGKRLAARGVDVILNPSASHFAFAKQETRREIVTRGSRDFGVSYVYTNLLGNESGRAIYDGGTLIATNGKIITEGPRFSFANWILTTADVEASRAGSSSESWADNATSGVMLNCEFELPLPLAPRAATPPSEWDTTPSPKEEEFARAVALGLFDYLRKSQAGGLVVSLSGGADSAAVATMAWLFVGFGIKELGIEAFCRKLPRIPQLANSQDQPSIVRELLSCVYQATRNSSSTTRNAARDVARAIGAEFLEWNIDQLVNDYVEMVAEATQRKVTWEHDDLALQNIQARVRGPGVWMVANLRGALLLTTSNRSEAAVGYATMDGDTCGGLAPIAGIDKAYLLDWLDWMQTVGPAEIGPLPALAVVTAQRSTAELRPPSADQTDEDDLMPYRVLDAVERAAIRDKLIPIEVFETARSQFPQYSVDELGKWVTKFFQLWCRNQWKRERYAPSFHLDDANLDPKTWCRFPILSGGFERELGELRDQLKRR